MSVIITLRIAGDPNKLEEFAAANPSHMKGIVESARQHGLIAHRFYGSGDDKIMVVDEWPDAKSFQAFFEEQRPQIDPMMGEAGVTAEPEVTVWRRLEAHDEYGWGE